MPHREGSAVSALTGEVVLTLAKTEVRPVAIQNSTSSGVWGIHTDPAIRCRTDMDKDRLGCVMSNWSNEVNRWLLVQQRT